MSTNKDLTGSDNNSSANVYAFPAGRRNVEWFNSRILSEDNYRRTYQASLPSPAGAGTIILDYTRPSGTHTKLTSIKFLIGGYYFFLNSKTNCDTLKAINNQIGKVDGECWAYIYQDKVTGTTADRPMTDFLEFACKDESEQFYGLFSGTEPTDTDLKIPIVVTGEDGKGDIDKAIDASPEGWYYKPWFQSSAAWAAGRFSDKNKIWVDNVYDVPHICVKQGDDLRWIPLGAVYKTSRNN